MTSTLATLWAALPPEEAREALHNPLRFWGGPAAP